MNEVRNLSVSFVELEMENFDEIVVLKLLIKIYFVL